MFKSLTKAAARPLAILTGGLLAASALIGSAATPAAAVPPAPHWGQFEWDAGQSKVPVRAFVLFDRSGDPTMSAIIKYASDWWNGERVAHPELPYSNVYRDDANAGACFVNQTPGYSIASACMIPQLKAFGINGISATNGSPHFIGGAFAVSGGLTLNEAFTAVCHQFGHILGLPDSIDGQSCMSHGLAPDQLRWYAPADMAAILALYSHDDGQAPVAVADAYSTAEDVVLTVNAPGVLANDTDADGDTLTATKVSDPAHGAVALSTDGSFTYSPTANFSGTDSFTYKASGGGTDSNVVTATITVTPVNDVAVATADSYSTGEDTPLVVGAAGVLANDTDPDGALTAVKVSDPAHGAVTLGSDGSFTYTPTANFAGSDSFTYKANDGTADSNVATVTITVNAVNDAPVAVDDTYTTTQAVPLVVIAPGLLSNDTDVEGGTLTATAVGQASNGLVTGNADGSFTYTPGPTFTGTDSFTYTANDGTTDSNVATVTITVDPA